MVSCNRIQGILLDFMLAKLSRNVPNDSNENTEEHSQKKHLIYLTDLCHLHVAKHNLYLYTNYMICRLVRANELD